MSEFPTLEELTETEGVWYRVDNGMMFGDDHFVRTTGTDELEVHTARGEIVMERARDQRSHWVNQDVTEFTVERVDASEVPDHE